MEKVSVVIITKDEEDNLIYCLESVKDFDEIIVVDSGSCDKTIEIAKKYTPKVFIRNFDNFSLQKNFAISKCKNDWVLSIDADEVVSQELKERIRRFKPEGKAGYRIRRNTCIFGRFLKYGGHSNDTPLRLFDRTKASFIQPIHEFVKVIGPVGSIDEPILHYSARNLNEYFKKLNLYTDLEVVYLREKKLKFYYLNIFLYPVMRFIQRYLLQRGFLDGVEGFIFYALSGFYDFIRWAKYWQYIKIHETK